MNHGCNAKVAKQHLVPSPDEHILGLEVAMDEFLLVGILQGVGNLRHVGDDRCQGVALTQRARGRVVHDQEGGAALHAKVQHLYNVVMHQARERPRFRAELLHLSGSTEAATMAFSVSQVDLESRVVVWERANGKGLSPRYLSSRPFHDTTPPP